MDVDNDTLEPAGAPPGAGRAHRPPRLGWRASLRPQPGWLRASVTCSQLNSNTSRSTR